MYSATYTQVTPAAVPPCLPHAPEHKATQAKADAVKALNLGKQLGMHIDVQTSCDRNLYTLNPSHAVTDTALTNSKPYPIH